MQQKLVRHPSGGASKHNFWAARVKLIKIIYLESSFRELSIDICMGRIGGGGGRGGTEIFGTPLQNNFLGHSYENLNMLSEFSAQAQAIGTLFEQCGLRGGSVDMSNSQRHTR